MLVVLLGKYEIYADERTVIALLRLYWLSDDMPISPARYVQEVAAAMHVQLSSAMVGYMAFSVIKCGNAGELSKVLNLLQLVERPTGAGAPKWLHKLAGVVGADMLRT
jgi:hypothetical protein